MLLVENISTDPAYNHALEEYLLRNLQEDIFMIWQNIPTVLLGRNQDAGCEYDADYAAKKNIRVVRRLSGGGAIYCDLRNLQYTLITALGKATGNPFIKFASPVVSALRNLGIDAEFSGRNDITVEGKKVSGNAQFRFGKRVLHHGTLLFDVDWEVISKILCPNPVKLTSKQVSSVPGRIGTLSKYLNMDVRAFMDYLQGYFMEYYGIKKIYHLSEEELQKVMQLKQNRFDAPDWNFGLRRERSTHVRSIHHPFGLVTYHLKIRNETIQDIRITGDFFGDQDSCELGQRLMGLSLSRESLVSALEGIKTEGYIHGMKNETLISDILSIPDFDR